MARPLKAVWADFRLVEHLGLSNSAVGTTFFRLNLMIFLLTYFSIGFSESVVGTTFGEGDDLRTCQRQIHFSLLYISDTLQN